LKLERDGAAGQKKIRWAPLLDAEGDGAIQRANN